MLNYFSFNTYFKKYLLLFIIALSWIFLLIPSLLIDETVIHFYLLIFYLILFVILQLIVISLLEKKNFFKSKSIITYFYSFYLFISFFSIFLTNTAEFLRLSAMIKVSVLLFFFLFFLLIAKLIQEKNSFVNLSLIVFIIMVILQIAQVRKVYPNSQNFSNNKIDQIFNNVEFINKPNIYITSYDALISKKIAKEHLGIEELDYYNFLDTEKAIIFKNSFQENVFTKPALNTFLFLDPKKWRDAKFHNHKRSHSEYDYFSGRAPSPLFSIFKNNGYKIATGYLPGAWSVRGKYVDEYNNNENFVMSIPLFCRWSLPWYYFKLANYCNIFLNIKKRNLKKNDLNINEFTEIKDIRDKEDFKYYKKSILNIKKKSKKITKQNWITFFHTYRPGHTNDNFVYNEKQIKVKGDKGKTDTVIIKAIKQND